MISNYRTYSVLKTWFSCYKDVIGIIASYSIDENNNTVIIYTNRPGIMIGYKGTDVNAAIKTLRSVNNNPDIKIQFVEVTPIYKTR